MSIKTDSNTKVVNKTMIKKPKKYHVILINDDFTPMGFVVDILKIVFNHTESSAFDIMMKVHNDGRGIAGTYSFEIAEQKVQETLSIAQINNCTYFKVVAEPES